MRPSARPAGRAAAWLTVVLLVAACGPPASETETRHRFMAMGTLVDVTVFGVPRAEAEAAAAEVEELFHALHREWDPWGDGALANPCVGSDFVPNYRKLRFGLARWTNVLPWLSPIIPAVAVQLSPAANLVKPWKPSTPVFRIGFVKILNSIMAAKKICRLTNTCSWH